MQRTSTAIAAAALFVATGVAGAQGDGPRNLYVVEIAGTWTASTGAQTVTLRPLSPVSTAARLQLTAGDQSEAKIVLRDPRTLFLRRRICTTAKPCGGQPIAVTQLDTVKTGLAATAQAAGLYADLGERAQLRERVRLVGARGTERDIGITVVTRDGPRIDMREILARVQQPADRLVARFCSLTDPNIDETECIESRRRAPTDCDLTSTQCELAEGDGGGAYRVDVYVRERSMLASVSVASGFAAVIPAAARAAASTKRDELMQTINQLAAGLTAEELRAISAAATLSVARVKR